MQQHTNDNKSTITFIDDLVRFIHDILSDPYNL